MNYGYGNWLMAIVNIAIFYVFIKSSFRPKTKLDWRSFHAIMAFVVALFVEMYGFPLTIYILTSYFGNRFLNLDFSHNSGHLLNDILGLTGDPHFSFLHISSNVLIIGGLFLLAKGWEVLYKSQRSNHLATTGVYRYIRHPQYLAFILIIIGFLLQWPTIITLLMAPILIIRYIRLGICEEKLMLKRYGAVFESYKKETPGYIPSLKNLYSDFIKRFTFGTR